MSDQTQDPKTKGQGQKDPVTSTQPTTTSATTTTEGGKSFEQAVADLATRLQKTEEQLAAEKKAREKAEQSTRAKQSAYDRLQAQKTTPQSGVPQPVGLQRPGSTPARDRLAELEDTALQAAKENILLREAASRGIPFEEVEGLQFENPTELALLLDNLTLKRQMQDLQQTMTGAGKQPETKIDTGEGTGGGAAAKTNQLVEQYKQARAAGRTQEARWRLLNAIHADPNKLIQGPKT